MFLVIKYLMAWAQTITGSGLASRIHWLQKAYNRKHCLDMEEAYFDEEMREARPDPVYSVYFG